MKTYRYAALSLLTLGFASCSQEEGFAPQGGEEQEIHLNITAGGVQTRVNTLEGGDVWEDGDELYFCRISKENQWAEHSLTAAVADEVTTWTPDSKLYWDDNGEHKLVVNYPAGTGWAWDTWYILADQSTLPNLKKADHMNAMWKGTPTTEPINLNLKHRMSMVTVTYTFTSEFEPTVDITPEVYSYTQCILFDINTLERREVAWEEGHDIWVKAYKHDENQFTAIVSPDAYSAGDEFIRITADGKQQIAKMPEAITFAEGTHYTFNLTIGKTAAELTSVSVQPWTDGGAIDGGEAEDVTPVIDGTLGGKTEATEEDITALVEQLKAYVDNGFTTITVPGSQPAMITVGNVTETAIGEAIYRLSSNGSYSEDNQYNGKIDLILPDVTEIIAMEFYAAFALNSITLPKVTTVGDGAFTGCYYLKKMTFGSVVTSINQSNSYVFYEVGRMVDGGLCDLVLNCGQLQTEDTYKPDLENNVWYKPSWGGNVTWKSITLTHTGECDECKANQ
ncbi:MAG: fimbrillin family protein [Bacteroidaceae bacterium]|nr:fimbrillin family protein [Bacteroidaceae bacterium]